MIKAVIFDMGGVILRTVDPGKRDQLAKRFGTTRQELEKMMFLSPTTIQTELGEISDDEHLKAVMQHFGQPVDAYHELYKQFYAGDAVDLAMIDYIKSLKADFKVGLLSNAWANTRKQLTSMREYFDLFDVCMLSAEVGLRKPDERIYRLILERLDVAAQESIFVDDIPINIDGGSATGMHTVHYRDREQAIQDINKILKEQNAV